MAIALVASYFLGVNPLTVLNVIIHGCVVGSRVVMALFAIKLGASPFEIGIMIALYSVPPLCFGVYTGRITDRYGVHKPMVLGAVLCVSGLLLPYLWPVVVPLYFSATILGLSFMFYTVAIQNLTGAWGPREERAKNFSTLSIGYSPSGLLGPVLAGYAIEYAGHRTAYLAFALSALVPLITLLAYRPLREFELPKSAAQSANALELLRQPELRKVLINSALVVSGFDLYMFYMPIYGDSIGMSASRIGTILGVFSAATFIMRFSMPFLTVRWSARDILSVSMFCCAALFIETHPDPDKAPSDGPNMVALREMPANVVRRFAPLAIVFTRLLQRRSRPHLAAWRDCDSQHRRVDQPQRDRLG